MSQCDEAEGSIPFQSSAYETSAYADLTGGTAYWLHDKVPACRLHTENGARKAPIPAIRISGTKDKRHDSLAA